MKKNAASVEDYLAALPPDRRAAIQAVRESILRHLPTGYVECIGWGIIAYAIPLSRFADTYNGQPLAIAALGAQKNYMVVHLMNIYGNPKMRAWFELEYKRAGKQLDAGKACIRFKKLDDLPVDLIGRAVGKTSVDQLIAWHEMAHAARRVRRGGKLARPKK